MKQTLRRRHEVSGFDLFKVRVVQCLSLLGFVLFAIRYGWEQVSAFIEHLTR